jgi:hypothetical protein
MTNISINISVPGGESQGKPKSMFRSLGVKSARQDMRGIPGDLDGVGAAPAVSIQGPEPATDGQGMDELASLLDTQQSAQSLLRVLSSLGFQ